MSVSGPGRVIDNGLVLYLDASNNKSFVSGSTTWFDVSRNGNNGTLTNGPAFNSANGGSIVFDGSNDYFVGSGLPSGTNNFTYSVWIYFNGNITGNFGGGIFAAVLMSGNTNGSFEFIVRTSGSTAGGEPPADISFGRYGQASTGVCLASVNMPVGRYHNIVLVRDGSASQKMYQNGIFIGSGNLSSSGTAASLYIGGAPAQSLYSAYHKGNIASVLIYNRALSADEILQNYNLEKKRFGL
jgi:hypothetical protein